jgi:hypothetical protein
MHKDDEEFVVKVLKMFEQAYFRSSALETILEFQKIPRWKEQAAELATHPNVQPQLRAAFQRIYASFEHDQPQTDRPNALQELLKLLPTTGKIQ